MTLPTKYSRNLRVDGREYRWLVSRSRGQLNLTVHAAAERGQVLRAFFEPHDRFVRHPNGGWERARQDRVITPQLVSRVIRHGLANGWEPAGKKKPPLVLHAWRAEELAPALPKTAGEAYRLKDLALEQVGDLQFDLSIDSEWRRRLFAAPVGERLPIPADYRYLMAEVRAAELRFAAFNDGVTESGFIVFGIESVDFPGVTVYTTNNPQVI